MFAKPAGVDSNSSRKNASSKIQLVLLPFPFLGKTWPWVKKRYPKNPTKRKNRPKSLVPKGGIFLTHSNIVSFFPFFYVFLRCFMCFLEFPMVLIEHPMKNNNQRSLLHQCHHLGRCIHNATRRGQGESRHQEAGQTSLRWRWGGGDPVSR